ncbi:N-acetyltransferase B complex non catalytic subunit-domain-containing protein [Xylariaceae sp. FL0016]|nr:N-acetyltransferase B complex non catalytic subunit-domain-containing protein [Xylariaceae sp. FL0016]
MPRAPPFPRPVRLKDTCDMQLQSCWDGRQWGPVMTIARNRFKATKDDYYLAVEAAAKAHSDNVADQTAGKVAVEKMIKENVIIKDADALDLYEFACADMDMGYSETIGLLRARLVKALPKDYRSSIHCFESCTWYSDWANAQQIAASLDRNFPQDSKSLFRNILLTYIFSISDRCPEDKRKLFIALAKAQAEKASKPSTSAPDGKNPSRRGVTNDEEHALCLSIRLQHSSREDNLKYLASPETGPLVFIQRGFTQSYRQAMSYLREHDAWDQIFTMCQTILEKSIVVCGQEHNAEAPTASKQEVPDQYQHSNRDANSLEDRLLLARSCDWVVWESLVVAAKQHSDSKKALKQARQLLDKNLRALQRNDTNNVRSVFKMNFDHLVMLILFARGEGQVAEASGESTRVTHLLKHLNQYYRDESFFEKSKGFIAKLSQQEIGSVLNSLGVYSSETKDACKGLMLASLRLKLRFFQATSLRSGEDCPFCGCKVSATGWEQGSDCANCLKLIAEGALQNFSHAMQDDHLINKELPNKSEDPLSDLTLLGATCLLKLSGVNLKRQRDAGTGSPLFFADTSLFFQAVAWVDFYVTFSRKNSPLRLLLVKLYLLIGCVSQAKEIWDEFGVKNVILDSLGALFFDRLSTISPGDFAPNSSRNCVDPLITYYTKAVRRTYPDVLRLSIEKGNYMSALNEVEFVKNMNRSCTLVMSVVEERRGLRIRSGKNDSGIADEPLVKYHTLNDQLQDVTDYNYLPSFAGPESQSIQDIVSLGPLPTNSRCQLGLMAERFIDIICNAPQKDFKPTKPHQSAQSELQYAVGTCKELLRDTRYLISHESTRNSLTGPERMYFRTVQRLMELFETLFAQDHATSAVQDAPEALRTLLKQISDDIQRQVDLFLELPEEMHLDTGAFYEITSMHAMGMLRETALVTKHTVNYVTVARERYKGNEKARNAESAWLTLGLKNLSTAATNANAKIYERIGSIANHLSASGWMDRIRDWTFLQEESNSKTSHRDFKKSFSEKLADTIPDSQLEMWANNVAESWRVLISGWKNDVKFDDVKK